jgi:hypothetical protein
VSDTTTVTVAPQIPGLGADHQALVNQLVGQIQRKSARNRLRRYYYDHKTRLKDLGIAIPPSMRDVETVIGWPAKAVDSMSRRTVLEGFTTLESDATTLGLTALWDDNRMASEVPQAHTSALMHSTAFVFVTAGDQAAGEPPAIISVQSAESASGIWDRRRRMLSAALSIISTDSAGVPSEMVLYVPNLAIIMRRSGATWDLRQSVHDLGVPVELLTYRAALDRPFGSSRISRPVMALTDSAVRTLLRTEVSAEFFSAPQRYVLGADEDAFVDPDGNPVPAWQAVLGRLFAVSRDENDQVPTVGQFPQQSMEPHLAQIRSLASLFAAETSLPVGSLGIVQDNPSSAEAIYAAKEELIVEIQHWETTSLAPAWERSVRNALRLIDDSPAARAAYAGIRAHWSNPATPSIVSASDAMVKQIAAIPKLADTDVALEKLGYSQDEMDRMQSQWRRASASSLVTALAARAPAAP